MLQLRTGKGRLLSASSRRANSKAGISPAHGSEAADHDSCEKGDASPTIGFKDPKEVVANDELTRDQKIEILRRWEYDAHEPAVAEEEAGMAVRRPKMFDRVFQALHTLGVERDTVHTPPTK